MFVNTGQLNAFASLTIFCLKAFVWLLEAVLIDLLFHFSTTSNNIEDLKSVNMADEEKPEYFYRLVCLVVELGTEGLLKVLEKETHGEAIQSFLANRSSKIDNLRYKKKVLKEKQYKLLKAGNVSEFDISLLYVLIRNLTNLPEPIDKWDATYHRPSDTSPAANVARLKLVRNEAIAHCPKCCMKKSKFDESWTDAENALLGLARYYDEEDAMKNKIEQVKMKELIEGEECPLDKLVKWKFDEMGTKIEQVNQKVRH